MQENPTEYVMLRINEENSMKILSIVSSYRTDGNTGRVASLIEEQLHKEAEKRQAGLEIEKICLGCQDVRLCRGCRLCFDKGEDKCPLKDDLISIRDRMLEADGYLIASPVYVEDVNGILKNWMDRMAFVCHRPALAGKSAFLITTSGGGATGHALRTMGAAFNAWGCRVAGKKKFRTGALMEKKDIRLRYEKEIHSVAEVFLNDLERGTDANPGWYSLIAFSIQQICWQKAEYQKSNPFDYQYWKDKGWLEPKCTYYIPLKRRMWKVRLARLFGSGLARFFV
jgi:multimeric flavodoxin WrbA